MTSASLDLWHPFFPRAKFIPVHMNLIFVAFTFVSYKLVFSCAFCMITTRIMGNWHNKTFMNFTVCWPLVNVFS